MKYRQEVDGLRAVAVLPVILYHAGFSAFSGGYVGVDIFFVISGYLITTILLKELAEGRYSIWKFYERRARRILPALFVVIAVSVPLAAILMTPLPFQDFAQSVFAVAVFASNIFFSVEQADYFRQEAELLPLLHTWSLAVEEQFYIIFPVLLAAMWALGRRPILWVLIAIGIASFAIAEYGARAWPIANFYLLPSRAWELMAGALAAFALSGRDPRPNEGLGLVGLALLIVPMFVYDNTFPFPGIYAIPPVLGTVLIILFATPETLAGRLLSLRGMVMIGLISYSAYLWHQPVFAFARLYSGADLHGWAMTPLIFLSLGLAWASWRFVEQPFRAQSGRPPVLLPRQNGVFAASLVGIAAFAAFGVYGHIRDGMPGRFAPPAFVQEGLFELPQVRNGYCFYTPFHDDTLELGTDGLDCRLGDQSPDAERMLIFGDSYAGHWEPFWDEVGKRDGINVHPVTTNWCGPSLNENDFPATGIGNQYHQQCLIYRDFLAQNLQNYDTIVYGAEWDGIDGHGYFDGFLELLDHTLATTDANVILMTVPVKFTRPSVQRAVYFSDGNRLVLRKDEEERLALLHDRLAQMAAENPRLRFMDREEIFGEDQILTEDRLPYSLDGGHVSIYGSLEAAKSYLARTPPRTIVTN